MENAATATDLQLGPLLASAQGLREMKAHLQVLQKKNFKEWQGECSRREWSCRHPTTRRVIEFG
jgi:hypothetical protein